MALGEVFFIGRIRKRNLSVACKWFRRAGANKHPRVRADAIFLAAWCLEHGHGELELGQEVSMRDQARSLYRLSAQSGFELARVWCTADHINNHVDVEKQFLKSRLAALQNEKADASSMCVRLCRPFMLADAHEFGLFGLTPDLDAAMPHYRLAASRGLVDAEQRLCAM